MANIKSVGGNPIVLGLDGLTDDAKAALNNGRHSATSESLLGTPDTAQWAQRVTDGNGAATVRSVQGATVVWNQLVGADTSTVTIPSGNKYLSVIGGTSAIATSDDTAISVTGGTDQVFDLTQMFGSGNEPATVAEFEAMYPEAYYPYSAPTLKPVQIAGIQSVGFNQWDEEWAKGYISDTTGENAGTGTQYLRSKNHIPVIPSATYHFTALLHNSNAGKVYYYDAEKSFISYDNLTLGGNKTVPSNARYMRFWCNYQGSYQSDICISISNPALNGQYKPYTTDSVEWETQTLRAAGSVRDELTADELVTRVGVVDLGTLTWSSASGNRFKAALPEAKKPANDNTAVNLKCAHYATESANTTASGNEGIAVTVSGNVTVYDAEYAEKTVSAFKTAMDGVLLFYELATPTTTPISPALPMTYRVEQGGTESIVVPAGEVSAAPVLTVAEGESAGELVMDALACIAAPDGPVATANHAVGTYLTMQGKLYKVTSAIAVGETITAGTNVTQTTVMDELIALTA